MGGTNSIVNVFDEAMKQEQLNAKNLNEQRNTSFDNIEGEADRQINQRSHAGDMLVKKYDEGGNEKINKDRMNNLNDYEI